LIDQAKRKLRRDVHPTFDEIPKENRAEGGDGQYLTHYPTAVNNWPGELMATKSLKVGIESAIGGGRGQQDQGDGRRRVGGRIR
jgi:hypothetical protein